MTHAVEAASLRKVYKDATVALDCLDLTVEQGEVFGLLGPNGAGKTTAVMVLATLLRPSGGRAAVMGMDVVGRRDEARLQFGYAGQEAAVDDFLTARETLGFMSRIYAMEGGDARTRIEEVIALTGLRDRADSRAGTLSGGMRKRLDIGAALIHRPRLLILDEPMLSLDLEARHQVEDCILTLRAETGMTVLLSTHSMEDADLMCDRVAILEKGRVKAIGAPSALKKTLGGDVVSLRLSGSPAGLGEAAARIGGLECVRGVDGEGRNVRVLVTNAVESVPLVIGAARACAVIVETIRVGEPSLDDVYRSILGGGPGRGTPGT